MDAASSSSSPLSCSPTAVKVGEAAALNTPIVTAKLDSGVAGAPKNGTEADTVLDNHEEGEADIAATPADGEIAGMKGERETREGGGAAATAKVDISGASVGVAAAMLSCSQSLESVKITETGELSPLECIHICLYPWILFVCLRNSNVSLALSVLRADYYGRAPAQRGLDQG